MIFFPRSMAGCECSISFLLKIFEHILVENRNKDHHVLWLGSHGLEMLSSGPRDCRPFCWSGQTLPGSSVSQSKRSFENYRPDYNIWISKDHRVSCRLVKDAGRAHRISAVSVQVLTSPGLRNFRKSSANFPKYCVCATAAIIKKYFKLPAF